MGPRAAAAIGALVGLLFLAACRQGAPTLPPPPASYQQQSQQELQLDVAEAEPSPAVGEAQPSPAAPPAAAESAVPLPQTAALPAKRICLDPGHDASSPGASAKDASGRVIFDEHVLTLEVAYRLKPLLEAAGFVVCVTRAPDGTPVARPRDENGNGRLEGWERAQAKIDYINAFGAQALVSIHFNGISDPSIRGSEVYYSDTGPYEANNRLLARTLLDSLVAAIRSAGYQVVDRGIKSDNYKPYGRLWILGHNDQLARKARWQAGALVEVVFLSNPSDVAFLRRPDALDVIVRGLQEGLLRFWAQAFPSS
jgi:N-acetylmuramoyl-L-alanine amidase